jgi:hypothetical protein
MESHYDVSAEAQNDLFEIWERIAGDSVTLANRIEDGRDKATHGRISHTVLSYSSPYTLFWWSISQTSGLSASWLSLAANVT